MEKQNEDVIAARVPKKLKDLVQRYLQLDTHLNESDLLRDAIREKIKRDAPKLFDEVFQEKQSEAKGK